jgi:hypothetical protein
VTDHANQALDTAGATAVAVVSSAKAKTKAEITLEPAGENVLKGAGTFASDPSMRVKLTVIMAGAKAATARFTPLKKKRAARRRP